MRGARSACATRPMRRRRRGSTPRCVTSRNWSTRASPKASTSSSARDVARRTWSPWCATSRTGSLASTGSTGPPPPRPTAGRRSAASAPTSTRGRWPARSCTASRPVTAPTCRCGSRCRGASRQASRRRPWCWFTAAPSCAAASREWDGWAQFLASRGYLVIEPEFRGSEGYGDKHYRDGFRQWGQAMQDDIADSLVWARQQKLASDRACIAGASYGGYATLMGLAKDGALYRCGVAWLGVTDLMLLVKGDSWVDDDLGSSYRSYMAPTMVGDAVKDADMLKANSPVLLADRIRAPLLLAYGERDVRVPIEHGERMRDALVKAGRPPEWITYRGEAHGFGNLDNSVDFAKRVEVFLAKHLKDGQGTQPGGQ
ncbi:alpha/beta hydrolase family protein [Roseateles sp. UC29_93]|uniref:alpha/beta hydrolase family protein n=1 Tax=Roseateles sp. UC29_93 TaxID=3350177 RepID=UPI00366DE1E2